ncbi:hypothetical protein ELI15_14165 [Rhizobium ruizarguesonis]|uniref:hypothetical protein n=1 Tax=Rhizobium ruizarguesonis TaxID=2081791 RepID=UPI001032226F|nr:hypothetical protein [Rhizobium ruizarguesonis]TAW65435.1 hypothetical protein ELI15_14165 [Rhizobium ruizarguesonis]
MSERYFKIDADTRYVTSITIGQAPRLGVEFVQQSLETTSVRVGWSLVDGQFVDTTAAYQADKRHQ